LSRRTSSAAAAAAALSVPTRGLTVDASMKRGSCEDFVVPLCHVLRETSFLSVHLRLSRACLGKPKPTISERKLENGAFVFSFYLH
jgi:hypothetical protein